MNFVIRIEAEIPANRPITAGRPSSEAFQDLNPMIELFEKGGPIMWPRLVASIVTVTVVIDRLYFIVREYFRRDLRVVREMFEKVERGDLAGAVAVGAVSKDFVARTLTYALTHRDKSVTEALLRAAAWELKRFNRGISILDTVITLAPLLGLLGTVTGMIHSFGLLGGTEIEAPQAIAGGIAEALIATAGGLAVAIVALLPFNYLNAQLERARDHIQDAATHLELHLANRGAGHALQDRELAER
ncbi:MAG: MotA/TolQ/ExbB proton channel family protein [Terrimicrobiaceae bacterium]